MNLFKLGHRGYQKIVSTTIRGIFFLIPSVTTIYVFFKLFALIDGIVPSMISKVITDFDKNILPGVGIAIIIIVAFIVGTSTDGWIVKRLVRFGDTILSKIPMMNKIYTLVQQIVDTIQKSNKMVFEKPVLIEYPKAGTYCIGFVTANTGGEIVKKMGVELYSIFVPTTPNPTSGFLLFIPKDEVKELEMSVETAIKTVISAGIISEEEIKRTTTIQTVSSDDEKGLISKTLDDIKNSGHTDE